MIQELDVVSLICNIKTVDVDGDEILLKAGTQGTVIVGQIDSSDCVVEFGDQPEHMVMVPVSKKNLKLVWSHAEQFRKKFAS